mmetsp:Transcript_747/g.1240  ORF Transcript_747/g.1240 Transcript_747/m.1240 type:complete len:472 (+) Transcript_747:142-1557(+)|eukprot:CAMPEP_0185036438 /NCGR_PEP_ID=MMETSP1103-20130426/29435_1 /TAXON_ID=36769 /ORGANISM="Paraphysomonas bandaiensis, Strain Caron Lab Isolate" /LENGTH=471 /DNA_ID=CAMNT_0027573975 /DNA_START=36 /DNA_END=1451 /DNA_ORIENTATION=-
MSQVATNGADFPSLEFFRSGLGLPQEIESDNSSTDSSDYPSLEFFRSGLGMRGDESLDNASRDYQESFKKCAEELKHAADYKSKVIAARNAVKWAVDFFGESLVMSTSFGIQSAVLLHLATSVKNGIPTVWIDTGYLPPETYHYALHLKEMLQLNLKVYQSDMTPSHMEALHGRLWESESAEDRRLYGLIRKVLPMKKAMQELNVRCLMVGLRRGQTDHRARLSMLEDTGEDGCKLYPLLNWTPEDVAQYFAENSLPPHPLSLQGYTTVGDAHSSRPRTESDRSDRDTRFGGTGQQECGLHTEVGSIQEFASLAEGALKSAISNIPLPPMPHTPSDSIYTVYGRVNCKYCRASKALLQSRGLDFEDVTVLREQDRGNLPSTGVMTDLSSLVAEVRRARQDHTYSVSTVPQVFNKGQHIGGYTELCQSLEVSDAEREERLATASNPSATNDATSRTSESASVEISSDSGGEE